MERSESIKHLAAALNKAQAEMSGAKKGKENPFFKSSYADLNAVVDAIRIPFAENGLSYSQFPLMEENRVGVETILMHESGEFIVSTLMLPTGKLDAQAAGSAITYARRYALQAVAGIPSEDDDGNQATQGGSRQRQPAVRQQRTNTKPQQVVNFNPAECLANFVNIASSADMQTLQNHFKQAWGQLNGYPEQAKAKEVYDIRKQELTPQA